MGRRHLSVNEAAELIDVTPQTVHRLIRNGILTPEYEQDGRRIPRPRLRREDVEAYAEARSQDVSPHRQQLLVQQAIAQNRSLERRLTFLEDAIGARLSPPALDEESVLAVYAEVEEDLSLVPVSTDRILRWARLFLGIGEEFFDVLEALVEDEDCCLVFLELGQVIAMNVPHEHLDVSQDLRVAYSYLEVGRRNLRAVAFNHLRTRLGVRSAMRAVGEVDDVHDEVLNFANVEVESTRARR
jgi:excisionase family DNA binding protein